MIIGFNSFSEQIHKLGMRNSEELALYLLEKYQVALLPGSDFGFEETEFYFRLAFVDFDGRKVIKSFQGEIDSDFIQKESPNIAMGTH